MAGILPSAAAAAPTAAAVAEGVTPRVSAVLTAPAVAESVTPPAAASVFPTAPAVAGSPPPVPRSVAEMIAFHGIGRDTSGEGTEIMLGTSQVWELNQLIRGMVRDPLDDMPISGPIPNPDEFDLAALPSDVLADEWAENPHMSHPEHGEINCLHAVTGEHFTVLDIRGMAERKPRAREVFDPFRERVAAPNLYGYRPTWEGGGRIRIWSPPESVPSFLRGPVAEQIRMCWVRGWQAGHRLDPRWLFASRAVRNEREQRLHAHILLFGAGAGAPNVLMAGCSWCSQPTGCFCDGDEKYNCGLPLCSLCDKIFATCRACTLWCGLPDEVPLVPGWDDMMMEEGHEAEAMRRDFAAASQP